jgi:geranylgeranyl diphosphate synthase type II
MSDAISVLSGLYAGKFDAALKALCEHPDGRIPQRLMSSMSYSLLAGGKRLRPALCLAAAERCGVSADSAMPMAIALEFMHTASLIHDDLPCMDDDDLRRGAPTNHVAFGECMAVLAGDSLMIWSFGYALENLPKLGISAKRSSRAVAALSDASGPAGMCGGQALDTDAASRRQESGFVYEIAEKKTAALIRAALVSGAALGDADENVLARYSDYGTHLGLAFQIVDDILDVTATAEELGKTPNKDVSQDKITFVSTYGLEGARQRALEESEKAVRALAPIFPEGDLLLDLAEALSARSH